MEQINESNVYKIDFDEDYFYLKFARTEKKEAKVSDKDVSDAKEIKISAKFLTSFIRILIDKLEQYEKETGKKVFVSDDDV